MGFTGKQVLAGVSDMIKNFAVIYVVIFSHHHPPSPTPSSLHVAKDRVIEYRGIGAQRWNMACTLAQLTWL